MAVVVVHDSGLDGDLGGVVTLTAHLVEEPLHRWRHLTLLVTLGWTVHAKQVLDPENKKTLNEYIAMFIIFFAETYAF